MRKLLVFVFVLVGLSSSQAAADAILVSDQRSLEVSATGLGCATEDSVLFHPSAAFAPFDESHTLPTDLGGSVSAGQDSLVGTTQMSGSALVGNSSGTTHFCGVATYQVGFQLDQATPFLFDGTLDAAGAQAFGSFWLGSGSGPVFSYSFSEETGIVSESGTLAAGDYTLLARVTSGEDGNAGWDFQFQLVPEPSTALLLAAGLGMLALRRRA